MKSIKNLPAKIVCSSFAILFSSICLAPLHSGEALGAFIPSLLFMISIAFSIMVAIGIASDASNSGSFFYVEKKKHYVFANNISKIYLLLAFPLSVLVITSSIFISLMGLYVPENFPTMIIKMILIIMALFIPTHIAFIGWYLMKNGNEESNEDKIKDFYETKTFGFFAFLYGLQLFCLLALFSAKIIL